MNAPNTFPTGEPGVFLIGTLACPVCGATATGLLDQVDIRRYRWQGRRRGKPISPATSAKLAKPLLHFGVGCRFVTPTKGPSFPVKMAEWREGDFYDTVTFDAAAGPPPPPPKRWAPPPPRNIAPRGRRR